VEVFIRFYFIQSSYIFEPYVTTECSTVSFHVIFFYSHSGGVESILGPLGTSATEWPIVPVTVIMIMGVFGGMKIGRGNRSTRRKPAPVPLCPPQIPHDLTWTRTRAVAVGSQRLTAWAMARPSNSTIYNARSWKLWLNNERTNQWTCLYDISVVCSLLVLGCFMTFDRTIRRHVTALRASYPTVLLVTVIIPGFLSESPVRRDKKTRFSTTNMINVKQKSCKFQ
jgi:hypothetical protein